MLACGRGGGTGSFGTSAGECARAMLAPCSSGPSRQQHATSLFETPWAPVLDRCPKLGPAARARIEQFMVNAAAEPRAICGIDEIECAGRLTYRLRFHVEDRLRADVAGGIHDGESEFGGFHATSPDALASILKDRKIRRIGFAGVFCLLVVDPKGVSDLLPCLGKCLLGKRDFCGAVCEVFAVGRFIRSKNGGLDEDNAVVNSDRISHMKTSSDDRWCVPEHRLQLTGLWICDDSFSVSLSKPGLRSAPLFSCRGGWTPPII